MVFNKSDYFSGRVKQCFDAITLPGVESTRTPIYSQLLVVHKLVCLITKKIASLVTTWHITDSDSIDSLMVAMQLLMMIKTCILLAFLATVTAGHKSYDGLRCNLSLFIICL